MFTAKSNLRQALVVLPAGTAGRLRDESLRRWLSRSTLRDADARRETLTRVMAELGQQPQESGLAALRFWGQTGDRPDVWIAAADPVHLEARLDQPVMHVLEGAQSPKRDLRAIVDFLQKSLGGNAALAFSCIGDYMYLRGNQEIATSTLSASAIDGAPPDKYMPAGPQARAYLTLTSELQMCLHGHEVNLRREAAGLRPVNSIWLWGGGRAPERKVEVLPPLFGDDPLFRGYWQRCAASVAPWPGNFAKCLGFAVKDLVVVPPPESGDDGVLECYLGELRGLLESRCLDRLVLLFRDGLSARCGRFDAFRFWRPASRLL